MTISYYLPQRSTSQKSQTSERTKPQSQDDPPEYTASLHKVDDETTYPTAAAKKEDSASNTAIQELTLRKASPPPFPESLPDRAQEDKHKRTRNMLIIIIAVLVIGIIVLGLLLGLARRSIRSDSNIEASSISQTQTETLMVTLTVTQTQVQVQVQTQTEMPTGFVTLTISQNSTITSSSTASPSPTQSQDSCESELSLSSLFCTVSRCNAALSNEEQQKNECLGFCRINMNSTYDGLSFDAGKNLCSNVDSFTGYQETRLRSCCGKCGCL